MNLRTLTHKEFMRYAAVEVDELTSSDLEREMLRRLELIDTEAFSVTQELDISAADLLKLAEAGEDLDIDEQVQLLNAATKSVMPVGNIVQALDILSENDISHPDDLKEVFAFATKFQSIANDAGDVLARLNTLITETQES